MFEELLAKAIAGAIKGLAPLWVILFVIASTLALVVFKLHAIPALLLAALVSLAIVIAIDHFGHPG
jgi:hypothetical protein